MYKVFLCLRYLSRRLIAWFAIIAVALCVAMMLIATSVMDGFVSKIEVAAKGLFGDVVVDSSSLSGIGYYDEFIAEVKRQMPDKVEEASPFILTFGILETQFINQNENRQTVQVVGIRLPERVLVSSFGEGLTYQQGVNAPTFDPAVPRLIEQLEKMVDQTNRLSRELVRDHVSPAQRERLESLDAEQIYLSYSDQVDPQKALQLNRLAGGHLRQTNAIEILTRAKPYQPQLAELTDKLRRAEADGTATQPADEPTTQSGGLETVRTRGDVIVEDMRTLSKKAGYFLDRRTFTQPDEEEKLPFQPPSHRAIVGLGLPGFIFRTPEGKIIRLAGPGQDISLTLVPLGNRSTTGLEYKPEREIFTIIDESRTDVSPIDTNTVYIPFETLQRINNMAPDPANGLPGRTSQIHVKVKDEFIRAREKENSSLAVRLGISPRKPDALDEVAAEIETIWEDFHNNPRYADAVGDTMVNASSWRERQKHLVGQIQSQRTLVVIMFGIISSVAVVLIFVIFYMIVMQKTKDIGVIKSLGGSSWGVATIFLGYGAATGLVGSILGTIIGWQFVLHINGIHDWIGRHFGFTVWNREWFMFDQIPNQVEVPTAIGIVIWAILAGVVGALVPAIKASSMQPVEALRYE